MRHFFHSKAKLATLKFCGLRGWWGWGRGRCGAAPAFGAGLRRRRQKAEQADRGLVPSQPSQLLVALSPSQLVARRPPATKKFSRPAAQHPFWTGLRHRRQKAEQADRGLGLRLGSGLGLCSLSLSARRPPNFLGLRRSTHFGLAPAAQKAESRASRSGTTPSFKGGG